LGRLSLAAVALLLIAASPAPSPSPSPPSGFSTDPSHHSSIAPNYWLATLPAPPSTPGVRPTIEWPLRGARLTQAFGCTNFGLEQSTAGCPGGFHTGLDLAAPTGTPVHAAAAGIAYPLPDYEIYGNHVLIAHTGGVGTVYAHLTSFAVGWGQPVTAGEVIGYVGSTGNSTGPHLHFEVRYSGTAVDPMPWLDGTPPDLGPVAAGWPGYAATDDSLGLH
jgi:murein DD-endopeptidase MepM/ murein hydrolase activator NlpD